VDRAHITALILTYNEAPNIERTLSALSSFDEILIVDSGSTDETIEIAKRIRPDARILQKAFDTHTQQWNFGLDQVRTPWVLSLDADYELSAALAREIEELAPPESIGGYQARFQYRIHGHALRASVYPLRTVLFRRDTGRYRDDGHTQILETDDEVLSLVGRIFHDDRKPLSRWIQSQDRYATLEARHLLSTPVEQLNVQDRLRRKIVFAPPAMFLYLLFARGLIFDGWPGWFYVCQRTIAELLLSIRLLIGKKNLEPERAES
jgi:glycosyltransferase involved in cell wall biosynthesis